MKETFELIEKLNWFLQPVSKLILFFFTSSSGLVLLIILLFFYFLASLTNAIWVRKLALTAAKSNFGIGRLSIFEQIYIFFSELGKLVSKFFFRLPVVLGIFIFFIYVYGISASFNEINQFIDNQNRVKELSSVVRHLDKSYKVAEMKITEVDITNLADIKTSLEIQYYDYAKLGFNDEKQEITIKGNDIYFDAIVLNFEYGEIVSGEKRNIIIPYRIFSNAVPQTQGIELSLKDKNGVPYIFHRSGEELYGITADKFNERVQEVCSFLKDEKAARAAGIRSAYGNAVHVKVKKGDVLSIEVEQTGGLVLRKISDF
jgi:hypothetical protein